VRAAAGGRLRFSLDPSEPEGREVQRVARLLEGGGLVVLPTDTLYALACSVAHRKAVDRMRDVKGLPRAKRFSLLFADLDDVGDWVGYLPPFAYRAMRRMLPGPYTFVLEAGDAVPKVMRERQRTVGVRVPACPITRAVVRALGTPLAATSLLPEEGEVLSDPGDLEARFGGTVAAVVDGGVRLSEPSTVIDLSGDEPVVVRVGKGAPGLFAS